MMRVLVAKIVIEGSEQLIAPGSFLCTYFREWKEQFLPEVSPENILDEAHGLRIGAKHLLRLLDLLAILRRDVLEFLGQITGLGLG